MLTTKSSLLAMRRCLNTHTRFKSWLNSDFVNVKPSVRNAITSGHPVVAVESTIITHGMPYPDNLYTAKEVENIVQESGAIPATIAVIDGLIQVGTTSEELEKIASCQDSQKLSRLDIGAAIFKGFTGGTTVSATMKIAERCGIPIFVTGGIGGVHRGAEQTFDISSDLTELGRTSVNVVCSGVKSILDISKTLEYLETQGVPVFTFGESKVFPAFFTRDSGCNVKMNLEDPKQAAEFIYISENLQMNHGSVIAVPIPKLYENIGKEVEHAIQIALTEAKKMNISGAAVTPFLLAKVNKITQGSSLEANIGLIKNNAKVGADIAVAYAKLKQKKSYITSNNKYNTQATKSPVVIGASCVDFISKCSKEIVYNGPSNPVDVTLSAGGVGRNVFEGLHRLGSKPKLLTMMGKDANGMFLNEFMKDMDLSMVENISDCSTGIYSVVFSQTGDVVLGFQDMKINERLSSRFTADVIRQYEGELLQSPLICLDGNLPKETSEYVCKFCKKNSIPLLFEPAEAMKSAALACSLEGVTYATPNIMELEVMASELAQTKKSTNIDLTSKKLFMDPVFNFKIPCFTETYLSKKDFEIIVELCSLFAGRVQHMIVSLGKFGAIWVTEDSTVPNAKYYSLDVLPQWDFMNDPVANVSGSGDSFTSALVYAIVRGESINTAIKFGLVVAQHTVRSKYPISRNINEQLFQKYDLSSWEPVDV